MSRFDIPAHIPCLTVAVGWDEPMQTFFAQVERVTPHDDEHDVVLWIGASHGEITDPDQINPLLVPFATLTEEHIEQLRQDQVGNRTASELQQLMARITR